jgi:hypothetical protein
MMSVTEVVSMAMAELLVVVLKASGRHGRTYSHGQNNAKTTLFFFFQVKSRHVDEADGHHVAVGVGVLPSRKGRRCYSGL